jgi:hypothetical protein
LIPPLAPLRQPLVVAAASRIRQRRCKKSRSPRAQQYQAIENGTHPSHFSTARQPCQRGIPRFAELKSNRAMEDDSVRIILLRSIVLTLTTFGAGALLYKTMGVNPASAVLFVLSAGLASVLASFIH